MRLYCIHVETICKATFYHFLTSSLILQNIPLILDNYLQRYEPLKSYKTKYCLLWLLSQNQHFKFLIPLDHITKSAITGKVPVYNLTMISNKENNCILCKACFFKSCKKPSHLVVNVGNSSIVALPYQILIE